MKIDKISDIINFYKLKSESPTHIEKIGLYTESNGEKYKVFCENDGKTKTFIYVKTNKQIENILQNF